METRASGRCDVAMEKGALADGQDGKGVSPVCCGDHPWPPLLEKPTEQVSDHHASYDAESKDHYGLLTHC